MRGGIFSGIKLASRADKINFFLKIYAQMPFCRVFSCLLRREISDFGDFLCAAASSQASIVLLAQTKSIFFSKYMRKCLSAWFSLDSCAEEFQFLAIFYARQHLIPAYIPLMALPSALCAAINHCRCHLPCFEIFLCSYMSLSAFPTTSPTASPLRRSAIP